MCRQCPGGLTRVDVQLHKPGEAASVLQQAQCTASGPGQPSQAGAPPDGLQLPARGPAHIKLSWTFLGSLKRPQAMRLGAVFME